MNVTIESNPGHTQRISSYLRKRLPILIPAITAFLLTLPSSTLARPNIVFIMADDLGYGDLGCYGSTINETPHIDALAASGLRFTDFHSSGPMCTPTRVATLTGMYQQRFGPKFDGAISGVRDYDSGLPLEAITIAELLQEKGYSTGCFGKWHLGYKPPFFPLNQGFNEFRGLGSGDGDFFNHIDRSGREDWWKDNDRLPEEGYTTDLITRHSIDFIKRHRNKPFFLYVPHLAIHFPWQGPDDPPHRVSGNDYANDKWGVIPDRSNVAPHVKSMIQALDDSVGEILNTIETLRLTENTLVVLTSDNGGYLTYSGGFENISSNGPLRAQKSSIYEGGHRVPTIVSWPGKIRPGETEQTAHSTDWFPTFANLAHVSMEELQPDGVDLLPLLTQRTPLPERNLFWRKSDAWAVRSGPWKLTFERSQLGLYHLENDLGETVDLANSMPEKVKALRSTWEKWAENVNRSAEQYQ
ncbi:sulfatase [Opitutaceae bacterium]|nr:sulfatase [Opitutaceae bacterium]